MKGRNSTQGVKNTTVDQTQVLLRKPLVFGHSMMFALLHVLLLRRWEPEELKKFLPPWQSGEMAQRPREHRALGLSVCATRPGLAASHLQSVSPYLSEGRTDQVTYRYNYTCPTYRMETSCDYNSRWKISLVGEKSLERAVLPHMSATQVLLQTGWGPGLVSLFSADAPGSDFQG